MEKADTTQYRPREFANLCGYSLSYVYRLAAEGRIPTVRLGKSIRIPRAAWLRFVERQCQLRPEPKVD
jgi:excisionase family DNA binding protein